jgi:hypothetical protein
MTAPYRRYTRELSQRAGYRATWLPNAPLRLGDVGVLDGESFDARTSLGALGIASKQRSGPPGDLRFSSDDGVKVLFDLPGEPAAARVEFESQGAFLFQAAGCVETQLDDLDALARELVLQRDLELRWKPDWVLVDTVVRAARATVLISESTRAELTLELDPAAVGLSTLVPEAGISAGAQKGEVYQVIGAAGLTPLYRVRRFRRSFLDWLRGRPADELARAAAPLKLRADEVFEAVA